ncbi:MAG TPA: serine hydrolase domain-containing protein [Puia sp.]|jgi:CubicO group peptidase (beta-lactamase class C family)
MQGKKIGFLLGFVCLAVIGRGQSSSPGFAGVDDWLQQHVKEMGGRVMLVVYKDGKVIYDQSVSEMSRRQKMVNNFIARRQGKAADNEDYTFSTRQPIASCSKWLSAALVMTFVDEGRLDLSDTVGKYLPVLSLHGKGGITIRQCLSHLTGIKEPPLKESLKEMKEFTSMDDAIAAIAAMPMEGMPGSVFHYSNAGLQIAGAILEKISGKSFETLFAERIAGPLGLRNTDFGKGRVALPAGGASSTPEDYMKFLVMILDKGVYRGVRVLSEKSVEEMQVNRLTPDVTIGYSPAGSASVGYGYGEWILGGEGRKAGGDGGAGAGGQFVSCPGLFGSFPWVDKERGYCAFLMTYYVSGGKDKQERYFELKNKVDAALIR